MSTVDPGHPNCNSKMTKSAIQGIAQRQQQTILFNTTVTLSTLQSVVSADWLEAAHTCCLIGLPVLYTVCGLFVPMTKNERSLWGTFILENFHSQELSFTRLLWYKNCGYTGGESHRKFPFGKSVISSTYNWCCSFKSLRQLSSHMAVNA